MFKQIFYTKTRVILLFLFLVGFFNFRYLPEKLSVIYDKQLLFVLIILLVLGLDNNSKKRDINTSFNIRLNILFTSLFFFSLVNCLSSYIFRDQDIWVTFYQWSPFFLLFLYYPLKSLNFTISSWEKILFSLFCIEMTAEIIQNLFPQALLFSMTSGNSKFLDELRCRIYGNGILYVGSLYCMNYALTQKRNVFIYWCLYLVSIVLTFLSGYRIAILGIAVSSMVMALRLKHAKLRVIFASVVLSLGLYGFLETQVFKDRFDEIMERQEYANLENDNYVRMITLNYYLHDHFKSPTERLLGSGLVKRTLNNKTDDVGGRKFESKYSFDMSMLAARYHIFSVDWGLIGFSWEGGIPAALILVLIAVMLVSFKTNERFLYISSFGIFALISSITSGKYHGFHNLIWTVLLLVMTNKLYQLDEIKQHIFRKGQSLNLGNARKNQQ